MKIVTVIGARPQFIKAATVSRVIAASKGITEILVHTGQHFDADMSDIFFEQMAIPKPHYHLGIGGGSHGAMTGRQLEKIEEVLLVERPDWVLVYGDTNSTLAGALAAAKLYIPVAHIEAGLRSFNRQMPEEINRVLTDHMATLLFTPTQIAGNNLLREGISEKHIHWVGDVMYDATCFYKEHAIKPEWFNKLDVTSGEFLLCTVHRAENTDNPQRLRSIFRALADTNIPIILPLHPRTRIKLSEMDIMVTSNIYVIGPVGYLEMVWLEMNCKIIVTDSGGVQKEAYFHKKPCIVLRDETEWIELVEIGANRLVGTDREQIHMAISDAATWRFGDKPFYGKGTAAQEIVSVLSSSH